MRILHDLRTRDELWHRQGELCAWFHHHIDRETAILVAADDGRTVVISWLAGMSLDPLFQQELAAGEFSNIFTLRPLKRDLETFFINQVSFSFEDIEWIAARGLDEKSGSAWWTCLAWASWMALTDPSQPHLDRAFALDILNGIAEHVMHHYAQSEFGNLDFERDKHLVWPTQFWSLFVRSNTPYEFKDHQVAREAMPSRFVSPNGLICPQTLSFMRRLLDADQTHGMFDPQRWWQGLCVAPDPGGLPFTTIDLSDPQDSKRLTRQGYVEKTLDEILDAHPRLDTWKEFLPRAIYEDILALASAHQMPVPTAVSFASAVTCGAISSDSRVRPEDCIEMLQPYFSKSTFPERERWRHFFKDYL